MRHTFNVAVLLAGVLMSLPCPAHEGHVHADVEPAPPARSEAPRAETATPEFEVVAVREDSRLVLYVNDYATNTPVADAMVEVEAAGVSTPAAPSAPGVYLAKVAALDGPGQHALTVSVTANDQADLLTLTLTTPAPGPNAPPMARLADRWPWLAGAIALAMAWLGTRAWRRRRLAAVPLFLLPACLVTIVPAPAEAHEGHSHGPETPVPQEVGSRPQRLPGGVVYLPKASQYQLGIRTQLAASATWPRVVELAGHVLADPGASALLQASQGGRIEAGSRGLPHVGMKVRRGDVLAWLTPLASSLERGGLAAASAELASSLAVAEKRLVRLRELEGSVPGKEIEAAALEVEGLRQRKSVLASSLGRREALVAPVSGEIAEVRVSIGQVLEARDVAFTVVNRDRLLIEALAYDPQVGILRDAVAATLDGRPVGVAFLGAGAQLKEHALPVQFRITTPGGLVVGQPVKVFARLAATSTGMKLPRAALVRGPAGESAIWLQSRAEVFTLQPVAATPLDAGHVLATGVADGARVVVQGASLLNQVR